MKTQSPATPNAPQTSSLRLRARAPLPAFLALALAGVFVVVALAWMIKGQAQIGAGAIAVGLAIYGGATAITGAGLVRTYPHSDLGLCNVVTFLRLVMVCALIVALVAGAANSWLLLGFMITALSLDGVDGWLARRQNLTSSFGARFDMEVDAVFAMTLALLAYRNTDIGLFVLLLGLPSYLFFVAKFAWPWLDNALPDLFSRKVVCVAQLAVLIALQIPLDILHLLFPLTILAVLALVWSFGRDILWLARTHR